MLLFLFKVHYEACPKFPLTCDGCGKKKISREKVKHFLPLGWFPASSSKVRFMCCCYNGHALGHGGLSSSVHLKFLLFICFEIGVLLIALSA